MPCAVKLGLKSKASRLKPEKADGKVKEWSYDNRNLITKVTYDGDTVLTKSNDLVRSISFGRQDNLRTKDRVIGIDELNFDYSLDPIQPKALKRLDF